LEGQVFLFLALEAMAVMVSVEIDAALSSLSSPLALIYYTIASNLQVSLLSGRLLCRKRGKRLVAEIYLHEGYTFLATSVVDKYIALWLNGFVTKKSGLLPRRTMMALQSAPEWVKWSPTFWSHK
jgi:hypothetical protein